MDDGRIGDEDRRKAILFLCTHNSARSQMAEGLMNALFGDRFKAYSAGVEPTFVDPHAVAALAEVDVDISHQRSKGLDDLRRWDFDIVVTVCDRAAEACPMFPGARFVIHRSFPDPALAQGSEEEAMEAFRLVRDDIRQWLEETFGSKPPR
ncbi:MAG: arsenate reductase ArsC [Methanotrichaceae archaeon]|nr:arsenate reductase ArsC [Methanotrichaceae archaeon]